MITTSKKVNARSASKIDSVRRVRPRLRKEGNNHDYFENLVTHDHDYLVSVDSTEDHQQLIADIPEVKSVSQIATCNIIDVTDDITEEDSSRELSRTSSNDYYKWLENIENNLNSINQNNDLQSTVVSSTVVSSTELSPSFSKKKEDTILREKLQSSPVQIVGSTFEKSPEIINVTSSLIQRMPKENSYIDGSTLAKYPGISNVTSTPISERTYSKLPEISSSTSVASVTSRLSEDTSNASEFSGKYKSKIEKLENNIENECNKAFNTFEHIKETLVNCGIKLNEDIKTRDNPSRNQPFSSKMEDFNDGKQSLPLDGDNDVTFAKDNPRSDDNLSSDVLNHLSNCSDTNNLREVVQRNEERKSLTLRIKQYERDLALDEKECSRKNLQKAKCYIVSRRILQNRQLIQSLKDELEEIPEGKGNALDSEGKEDETDEEGGEKIRFGSDKDSFGGILEAFASTNAATVRGLHNLQDSLSRCPNESEYADDPLGLTMPLMLHQKKALKWLIFRETVRPCSGGILADEMGLGKTLTIISLIVHSLPPGRLAEKQTVSEDSDDEWDLPSSFTPVANGLVINANNGGTLVVCPSSLLQQWENEIKQKTVRSLQLTVQIHHGNQRSRDPRCLCKPDIVITTYHLLHQDFNILTNVYWKRVVLDEAHYIRNPKTNVSQAACRLKAEKRWAITGTPVHNKPLDIYALIKFLKCSPWDDIIVWNRTMRGTRKGMMRLTTVLKTLVLRRTKEEMQASGEMPPLPKKITKTIEIVLNDSETEVYQTLLKYSQTLFTQFLLQRDRRDERHNYSIDQFVHNTIRKKDIRQLSKADLPKEVFEELNKALMLNAKGDIQQYHILVLLLRLRQICDHPALINKMIDNEEIKQQGIDEPAKKNNLFQEVLISTKKSAVENENEMSENPMRSDNPVFQETYESSKIKAILETMREILPTGEKIVIVSQWTSMLEVIEWHLSESGETRCTMFSGKVKISDRQNIIDCFNDPKTDLKVLLLSLTVGGQGLNLFGGNHLLMVDNHWNPQLEKQAEDRVHRYGQKKEVTIYKFLCKETIEERVLELQEKKLQLARDILLGIRLTSTNLTIQDLQHLFQMR